MDSVEGSSSLLPALITVPTVRTIDPVARTLIFPTANQEDNFQQQQQQYHQPSSGGWVEHQIFPLPTSSTTSTSDSSSSVSSASSSNGPSPLSESSRLRAALPPPAIGGHLVQDEGTGGGAGGVKTGRAHSVGGSSFSSHRAQNNDNSDDAAGSAFSSDSSSGVPVMGAGVTGADGTKVIRLLQRSENEEEVVHPIAGNPIHDNFFDGVGRGEKGREIEMAVLGGGVGGSGVVKFLSPVRNSDESSSHHYHHYQRQYHPHHQHHPPPSHHHQQQQQQLHSSPSSSGIGNANPNNVHNSGGSNHSPSGSMSSEHTPGAIGHQSASAFSERLEFVAENGETVDASRIDSISESEEDKANEKKRQWEEFKQVVYVAFEEPASSKRATTIAYIITTLIVVNTVSILIESLPQFVDEVDSQKNIFFLIECLCAIAFTLDFLIRLFANPSRKNFFSDILNIIDIIAVFPFYAELVINAAGQNTAGNFTALLRVLRLLRAIRIIRVSSYYKQIRVLYDAVMQSMDVMLVMAGFFLVFGSAMSAMMFYAERGKWDQDLGLWMRPDGYPARLQSLLGAMYWMVVTAGTVGYGDHLPKDAEEATNFGKFVSVITVVGGVVIIAMPISIIGMNFTQNWQRMVRQNQLMKMHEKDESDGSSISSSLPASLSNRIKPSISPSLLSPKSRDQCSSSSLPTNSNAKTVAVGSNAEGSKNFASTSSSSGIKKNNLNVDPGPLHFSEVLRTVGELEEQISLGVAQITAKQKRMSILAERSKLLQSEICFLLLMQEIALEGPGDSLDISELVDNAFKQARTKRPKSAVGVGRGIVDLFSRFPLSRASTETDASGTNNNNNNNTGFGSFNSGNVGAFLASVFGPRAKVEEKK